MRIKNPFLVNAEQLAFANPSTFEVPDARNSLRVGDYAKVCAGRERFWVRVKPSKKKGTLIGQINNDLVFTNEHGLKNEDFIRFLPRNVYQVMRKGKLID